MQQRNIKTVEKNFFQEKFLNFYMTYTVKKSNIKS